MWSKLKSMVRKVATITKMIKQLYASRAPFQLRSRWGSWCCCSPPSWGDSLPVASWHSIINSVLLETFISGTISANILWQQITSPCPWTWLFGSRLPLKIMNGKHYSALLSPFHKKLIGSEVAVLPIHKISLATDYYSVNSAADISQQDELEQKY